jgi:predicted ATP-grasp superfamily ATP-dependent carboligase
MTLPPVIVIGTNNPTGLVLVRELARHGVAVHAVGQPKGLGGASRYCHRFWARPQGAIAEWLPDLIEQTGAKAVIAWSESDLRQMALMPATVRGSALLVPRLDALTLALDKKRTLALAREVGILTPDTSDGPPESWPVVVKWSDPMGVMPKLEAAGLPFHKAEFCDDPAALQRALSRYEGLDEKPLVQSYAKGRGLGQMFYMEGGRATLVFQHERIHEWPPEGGFSSLCQSLDLRLHAQQRVLSEKLLVAMDWQGVAMVEYRWDPATDRYTLMEVNGRFWGSQPLAHHCGAEFAWELYRRRVLGETQPAPPYRPGVIAQYTIPELRRLARVWFGRSKIHDPYFKPSPWRDLAVFLGGIFRPRVRYYVWDWQDPRPWARDMWNIMLDALPWDAARSGESPPSKSERSRSGSTPPTA